ncbi:uncharacterized protein LOC111518769 [Drosophila willistoni]|uniref:uncharacterized protein LOC111518769 n=1 Tax=Drosophila willistoni TaxID=7260 RepID=UPI001F07E0B6|nr:uncharacterized protein LOC111518769 [Drosophila willistoni]XP_046866949.1 uncharacterized protein LOC111518769 [Drosophila willistoni]
MDTVTQAQSIDLSDLNDFLYDLIDLLQSQITGLAMNRVLQWISTQTKKKNVNLSQKIFQKLVTAMIAAFEENDAAASSKEHRQLVANVLECVQLQVEKFPSDDGKLILNRLWSLSVNGDHLHPLAGQILVQLLDNFDLGLEQCPQLLTIIQQLLQSDEEMNRQSALFIMHELEKNEVGNAIKCPKSLWSEYINALELLEAQQMPLNLISLLDNLKHLDLSPWLSILFLGLLQSENITVVYATVKYVVTHLKFSNLTDWNLVEKFLAATNRMQLFDVEDDEQLPRLFGNFLTTEELGSFIKAFVNVPWKWNGVPLYEWLICIPKEETGQSLCADKQTLLKLATLIKEMENFTLREKSADYISCCFQTTLDNLSIEEYLIFIDTISNTADLFDWDEECLLRKVVGCNNFEREIIHFTKDRLDKIMNLYRDIELANALIDELNKLPRAQHGWLRLFLITQIKNSKGVKDFYSTEYKVDKLILCGKDLKKLQQHLIDKLVCETLEEKSVVLEKSVDFFVTTHLNNWNKIEEFQLKPLELLQQGGEKTFVHLCDLLANCNDRKQDENILTAMIAKLKQFPNYGAAWNIGEYALKHLTIEQQQSNLFVDLICGGNDDIVGGLFHSGVQLPLDLVIQLIMSISIHTDDSWIMASYLNANGSQLLSHYYIYYGAWQPISYVKEIVNELLRINKEISEKNPRYRSNSEQHRTKFFIAFALLTLRKQYTDILWSALFSSTDQLNIILMYEIIVARSISHPDGLLERLQSIASLETDHQMSLLSVTNIFIHLKWSSLKEDQIQNMINSLLPLTVEAVLQVGQFANLIVNEIIKKSKDEGLKIPMVNTLPSPTGVKLAELSVGTQLEVRLLLPELDLDTVKSPWTWYMSNVKPRDVSDDRLLQAKQIRKAIKLSSIEIQPIKRNETILTSKIDIYPKSDLDSPNISANNADLIVAAVLMDERTNLNDLLQTCRALGVRSLIVSDSSNLSESSEDTLNIVKLKPELLNKYLREKKLENYNIVATQNTATNNNFIEYRFAKQTVLLFSNQQRDIPENLKPLLDNTIEIPHNDFQHAQHLLIFKFFKQYY